MSEWCQLFGRVMKIFDEILATHTVTVPCLFVRVYMYVCVNRQKKRPTARFLPVSEIEDTLRKRILFFKRAIELKSEFNHFAHNYKNELIIYFEISTFKAS